MKIAIDWDMCRGHAACMGEAPEVFSVTDKGELTVLIEAPDESLRTKVENAVAFCPTGAISLTEG